MKVTVHLNLQSRPVEIEDVRNCYQKGSFYCVLLYTDTVFKFPVEHIFRVTEEN